MRLFIAIQLSDKMKKALVGTMHELKKQGVTGDFIPMQNLHITVAFLGEVQDPEPVRQILDKLLVEKPRIAFSQFGNYGDVFWVGIKGNQKLKKYAADLRKELKEGGIPCDEKKFEPHVTLVRKQKGKRPAGLKIPAEDMMVTKVSLMKSEIKDGKRVYKEIYSVG